MKKILILAAVIIIPSFILAAGDMVEKGSPAYGSLETLAASGALPAGLTKTSLSRSETAGYVINAVNYLLNPDNTPSQGTIEIAYMLLKEFQTDLMEKGMKLSDIQQKMVDLKVRQTRLDIQGIKDKQDLLFGMIGTKINGEAAAFMTDVVLYGPGAGGAKRYTPLTQYLDLWFQANSGSQLKAEAVFRIQNLFGGLWGSQDIFGLRKFSITGDFPITFVIGDYQAKFTPLTLWAVDDERPNEANIFSDKRDMIKKELYLSDNAWPVTGAKAGYKGGIAGASVQADALLARIAAASTGHYTLSAESTQTQTVNVFNYDQFMWAGRVSTDCTLKDVLIIGGTFVEIKDITNTGITPTAPALDNYVASADIEIKLFDIVKASAEFAGSNYNVSTKTSPQPYMNKNIRDTALKTAVEAEYYNTKIEAEFFVIGNSFTAYAAQSRIYDWYNNYKYLTQNNTWNVSQAVPYYVLSGKLYPFTKYNNVILPAYYAVGRNLMPYVFYENAAEPYGGATPNRQGIKAILSGSYLDGMIEPYVRYLFSSEIVSYLPGTESTAPREYLVLEGGVKVKWLDLTFKGGYKYERTDNTYTQGGAHLESGIIDAGLDYKLLEKLTLSAGFRNISYKGADYPYSYDINNSVWAYSGRTPYDSNIISYGAGADYELTKQATAAISYTDTKITDRLSGANSSGAQELDARVDLKF